MCFSHVLCNFIAFTQFSHKFAFVTIYTFFLRKCLRAQNCGQISCLCSVPPKAVLTHPQVAWLPPPWYFHQPDSTYKEQTLDSVLFRDDIYPPNHPPTSISSLWRTLHWNRATHLTNFFSFDLNLVGLMSFEEVMMTNNNIDHAEESKQRLIQPAELNSWGTN